MLVSSVGQWESLANGSANVKTIRHAMGVAAPKRKRASRAKGAVASPIARQRLIPIDACFHRVGPLWESLRNYLADRNAADDLLRENQTRLRRAGQLGPIGREQVYDADGAILPLQDTKIVRYVDADGAECLYDMRGLGVPAALDRGQSVRRDVVDIDVCQTRSAARLCKRAPRLSTRFDQGGVLQWASYANKPLAARRLWQQARAVYSVSGGGAAGLPQRAPATGESIDTTGVYAVNALPGGDPRIATRMEGDIAPVPRPAHQPIVMEGFYRSALANGLPIERLIRLVKAGDVLPREAHAIVTR